MFSKLFHVRTFVIGMMILGMNTAFSQDFPTKPIRLYAGVPGGSGNLITRLIAEAISAPLGQAVIVENRPVPQGILAAAKSPPDGYSLYLGSGSIWIGPLLQKYPYDPVRDLAPVSIVSKQTNVLMVHPSLPTKTVKELIALARARPGQLNYTSGSAGSASNIAGILFASLAKVNVQYVPEGTIQADIMLISGQVEMMFGSLGGASSNIKAGKVRVLAITTAERSQVAPQFPTMAEAGLPGMDVPATNAVFGPVKTPPAVIQRLNQEIVRAIASPGVREKMLNAGIEPTSSTPEQLAALVKSEIAMVSKMVKDGQIKTDY